MNAAAAKAEWVIDRLGWSQRRYGIRQRLAVLVLLTAAPFLAVIVLDGSGERGQSIEHARQRAAGLARFAAAQQYGLVQQARTTLSVLQRLPEIADAGPNCSAILQTTVADHPAFVAMGIASADGRIVCHTHAGQPPTTTEPAFAESALSPDAPALSISRMRMSLVSHRPSIIAAEKLLAAPGEAPRGLIFAVVDLQWFAGLRERIAAAGQLQVTVLDGRDGTILARDPDRGDASDGRFALKPVMRAIVAQPGGGGILTQAEDGAELAAGFAPLSDLGAAGPVVVISIGLADIEAAAALQQALSLAAALAMTLLALGAAWLAPRGSLLRPLHAISVTARGLAGGDLAARVARPGRYGPELRVLAKTLNVTAGRLQRTAAVTKAALEQTARSAADYRELTDTTSDIIGRFDLNLRRTYVSPACQTILGYAPEEFMADAIRELIHPDDVGVRQQMLQQLVTGQTQLPLTYRLRHRDGHYVWMEAHMQLIRDAASGTPSEVIAVMRDVSGQREVEAEMRASEARFRLLADHSTDLILQLDPDLRRVYVSPASRTLLGFEPEELLDLTPEQMLHPDDVAVSKAGFTQLDQAGGIDCHRYRYRHKNGSYVWVEGIVRRLPDGSGYVIAARDLTHRLEVEERLEAANRRLEVLASQDGLTGLANRRHFDHMLASEFRRAAREQMPLSLLLIDVDHFKRYNDSYGHPEGDACLRTVSTAIATSLRRAGDLAARYGGEEIAVLLPGTDADGATQTAEAMRAAIRARALAHVASPFGVVTISAGVATAYPGTAETAAESLVTMADQALYQAKATGRDRVVTG